LLYHCTAKKICNLTVEEFGMNLILVNDLADWFPGETPILTEEEIKIALYNGQPEAWKIFFHLRGENVSTTEYNEILSFMRYQENNSNYKQLCNILNQQCLGNTGQGPGRNNNQGGQIMIINHMLDALPATSDKFDLA
jgi:hypothetical protein